ncbi:MAG: NADH-quinone oxidoreductase subunit J [Archaeoglobus sp.]|nr:NADH-quinone oxidoreductase subunit J [Archaeoglobus sp.]
MALEVYTLIVLSALAVIFAIGSLLSKDNFYSALYMSLTLVAVSGIYALVNLQEIFILITFIFVGAIGIVTVSLAAVYRFKPSLQLSKLWIIPSAITVVVLSYVYFTKVPVVVSAGKLSFHLDFGYVLLFSALTSLVVLLMLSVLSISRGGSGD